MSKQEDFRRPEKPLEKTREIDNEARISKKAKIKRKFIQLSSLIFLVLINSFFWNIALDHLKLYQLCLALHLNC